MAFPVIGGTQESGYNIDNSLRFNRSDSAYLSRTTGSDGNKRTWTWSGWLKRSNVDSTSNGFFAVEIGGGGQLFFMFNNSGSNNELDVSENVSGTKWRKITNQFFRDPSAWYHIVLAFDSTQSTASERLKLYVNGSQVTSFSTDTNPDQNYDSILTTASSPTNVGKYSNLYFGGYMSDIYLIDGQQLAPTEFGETDDNGVWIPKNYTGSYGTNGFKLEFKQLGTAADATSIGADTSGNDNHFSQTNVTPAVDRTEDTPTNNFATMNPLSSSAYEGSYTFAEGNTEMHWTAHATALSTMGVSSGKWYVEVKKITSTGSHNGGIVFEKNGNIGTLIEPVASEQSACGVFPLTATGELYYNQTLQQSDAGWTFAVGDILQYYIDLDNGTLKVKKNGSDFSTAFSITLSNSNDYSSGATTFFAVGYNGDDIQVNFGNPAFSISSSNSDPNGYGSFEYSTNDGTYDYYALCTKNLAEYG